MDNLEIKALRKSLKWSQEKLAKYVGAQNYHSVWRWEKGSNKPLPIFAEKLEQLKLKIFIKTPGKTLHFNDGDESGS